MQKRTVIVTWPGKLENGAGKITFGAGRFKKTYAALCCAGDHSEKKEGRA